MLQKREKILVIGTGLSAVIFVFNQFVCSSRTSSSAENSITAPQAAVAANKIERPAAAKIDQGLLKERRLRWRTVMFKRWGRDPFAASPSILEMIESDAAGEADSSAASDSTRPVTLNGLLWGLGKPVALIGDAILAEGERQGDLQVLKIGPDYVICRKGGKLLRLELEGPVYPSSKRPSP